MRGAVVVYVAVLDVYGSASKHLWYILIPMSDGTLANTGPKSSRAIKGGREYVYLSTWNLDAPDYAPVLITSESVHEVGVGSPKYTRLNYESGGVAITSKYCSF